MTVGTTPAAGLDAAAREALAELLLTLADDEFVLGFWDSEWTGIAPMLEEDVAFSSLAQDEIGHARVYYELLAELTGDPADGIAFGREPEAYGHCRLLDHPRTDWAFSVARRYLYDTADAVRLEALSRSSYRPLADAVAKIRREETYHLMHGDVWLRRLATGGGEARTRLEEALEVLWPDALTVFTPLAREDVLLSTGMLPEPISVMQQRWLTRIAPTFAALGLPFPFLADDSIYRPTFPVDLGGGRTQHGDAFQWLWGEFTSVHRLEAGAVW